MDSLITYSQTHQQLMNSLQPSLKLTSTNNSSVLNFQLNDNNYFSQLSLQQTPESMQQNKINDFFKMVSAQQPNTNLTTSESVSNNESFQEDSGFYNVAAAYNAVSASLVGRLASKYFNKIITINYFNLIL